MLMGVSVVERRYEAVRDVMDGHTIVEVAGRYGVSRQTVHTWLARYRDAGLDGLVNRSHRPKHCPHQMPPDIEARILELRRWHPEWGPARLRWQLGRDGVIPVPSMSGVYRCLVRHGQITPRKRRRRDDYRRWERGHPMELWQMDVMGNVLLRDGTELKAVTGIDDHSRFCVCAILVPRATAKAVCGAFATTLATHGAPDEVLTDNGKVFTGRLSVKPYESLFDRICRENGIEHLLTGVRAPTTIGKVERFHRTLRAEHLRERTFASARTAQAELDAWVQAYNADRPHQSLGMRMPSELFVHRSTAGQRPVDVSAVFPDRDGEDWVTRKVAGNGIISVAYQVINVGRHTSGNIVDVHLTDRLIEVWLGPELIRSVVRGSIKEVRNKHAQGTRSKDPTKRDTARMRQRSTEHVPSRIN